MLTGYPTGKIDAGRGWVFMATAIYLCTCSPVLGNPVLDGIHTIVDLHRFVRLNTQISYIQLIHCLILHWSFVNNR